MRFHNAGLCRHTVSNRPWQVDAVRFDMAWPSVTGHLAALKDADLVEAERDGTTVRYRLNISAAEEAVGSLLGIM